MKTYKLPYFECPLTPDSIHVGTGLLIDTHNNTLSCDARLCIGNNAYVQRCESMPFNGDWRDIDTMSLVLDYLEQFEA
jgi:hypothetical protein